MKVDENHKRGDETFHKQKVINLQN